MLFDFDGTLTRPGGLDFDALCKAIGCPPRAPILEFVDALPESARIEAAALLHRFEIAAAARAEPNHGAADCIARLAAMNIPTGILSRNTRAAVTRALQNFPAETARRLSPVIARDDGLPAKPDPAGVHHAAEQFGIPAEKILMVGDYIFDIAAGHAAGCVTAFLRNGADVPLMDPPPHLVLNALPEVADAVATHGGHRAG